MIHHLTAGYRVSTYRDIETEDMELHEPVETTVFRAVEEEEKGEGSSRDSRTSLWPVFGKLLPRMEIVFLCQMVIIYAVIAVALFNLTGGNGEGQDGKIWIALLSSCLGYMLPNPKLETRH